MVAGIDNRSNDGSKNEWEKNGKEWGGVPAMLLLCVVCMMLNKTAFFFFLLTRSTLP